MLIPRENTGYAEAVEVIGTLSGAGHQAYLVGGCVRDMLMGILPHDYDIATSAKPEEVLSLFPRCHEIGAAFGIINVVSGEHCFEVSTFREERGYSDGRHPGEVRYTDSPEKDASRRDFTINAMFYDPLGGGLLDHAGGVRDIRERTLRTVGDARERFAEDYLRLLRAVRFAVRFDLTPAPEMLAAISENIRGLSRLSAERIRDELNKMLTGRCPEKALEMLSGTGILREVLQEVEALKGVPQPPLFHPEGDVFVHTSLMLKRMTFPDVRTAWAILLHDAGKPQTLSIDREGVEHFYSHEEKSAKIAEHVMNRLKHPRKVISDVVDAVSGHMRMAHVSRMRKSKVQRLLAQENFPLHLELHRTDCMSSHARMEQYLFLLDLIAASEGQTELPAPLINGRDLIAMGMKPGRDIGRVLGAVSDMQLEGVVKNREEALAKAAEMLPSACMPGGEHMK